jgi:hypothetical protein
MFEVLQGVNLEEKGELSILTANEQIKTHIKDGLSWLFNTTLLQPQESVPSPSQSIYHMT